MVQPLSKLANPWKCDAPGCGILRANDANHWLIVSVRIPTCMRCEIHETTAEHDRHLAQPMIGDDAPEVAISKWTDELAELGSSKHACGVPCTLKIVAHLIMQAFFPAEIPQPGKEVTNATD